MGGWIALISVDSLRKALLEVANHLSTLCCGASFFLTYTFTYTHTSRNSPGDGTQTESGLVTPGGIASIPAGLETPDIIELRKKKQIEEEMDEGERPSLYTVRVCLCVGGWVGVCVCVCVMFVCVRVYIYMGIC